MNPSGRGEQQHTGWRLSFCIAVLSATSFCFLWGFYTLFCQLGHCFSICFPTLLRSLCSFVVYVSSALFLSHIQSPSEGGFVLVAVKGCYLCSYFSQECDSTNTCFLCFLPPLLLQLCCLPGVRSWDASFSSVTRRTGRTSLREKCPCSPP